MRLFYWFLKRIFVPCRFLEFLCTLKINRREPLAKGTSGVSGIKCSRTSVRSRRCSCVPAQKLRWRVDGKHRFSSDQKRAGHSHVQSLMNDVSRDREGAKDSSSGRPEVGATREDIHHEANLSAGTVAESTAACESAGQRAGCNQ